MAAQSSSPMVPLATVMEVRSVRLPIRSARSPAERPPAFREVPSTMLCVALTGMRPMVVLPFLLSSITRISPVATPLVMSAGAVTVRVNPVLAARVRAMSAFQPAGATTKRLSVVNSALPLAVHCMVAVPP